MVSVAHTVYCIVVSTCQDSSLDKHAVWFPNNPISSQLRLPPDGMHEHSLREWCKFSYY